MKWLDAACVPFWLLLGGIALWKHEVWNAIDCVLLALYAGRCALMLMDRP